MSKVRPSGTDNYGNQTSIEEKDPVEIDGEVFPALEPFVLFEHANRKGYEHELHLDEENNIYGITVFQPPDYNEHGTQEDWKLSYGVKVGEDSNSVIEVKFDPQTGNYRDGQQVWDRIIDRLEERTVKYHTEVKDEVEE